MSEQHTVSSLPERLTRNRTELLDEFPFFGRLLLRLEFGFAKCQTAYTDMRRIVFDPEFAARLSDDELKFVMLHEVMHCVLKHCLRGRTLRPLLYNIACDIVVNSCILEIYNKDSMKIDGCDAMHLAPDGKEGSKYSAEEIYHMLLSYGEEKIILLYGASGFDTHIVWDRICDPEIGDLWDGHIKNASKTCGNIGTGIPNSLMRYLKQIDHAPKTNWRQLLQDHLRFDRSDFSYLMPDRRFQNDVIMPSFQPDISGERAENIWFLIDTSGSVSDDAMSEAFNEICQATMQIDSLEGKLSFFDTEVSEPVGFESVDDLKAIRPVGGGGTSFDAIFKYMEQHMKEQLPCLVIIMTDGYCFFPEESSALGVPVIWMIVDSDVEAPWGQCVHIYL